MAAEGAGSTGEAVAHEPAAPGATSVLLVTPRWIRDGGVAAHAIASAGALAQSGVAVSVLAARVDPGEQIAGVTVHESPRLFEQQASAGARFGEALLSRPGAIHLHQFDDPGAVAEMRRTAPVVVSAHGYPACTSGVHYFRPGHECTRAHGPGCVPRLLACGHTSDPRQLPRSYSEAGLALRTLRSADLAISYSSAVDRHLAINGVAARSVVPLFTTTVAVAGSGHDRRRRVVFAGRVVLPKGINVLIKAARSVDAEFVVCGSGWRLEQSRRLAEREGVAGRFEFKGWLDGPALARELAEASVVAMPSIWPEPFGLVGLEAFAAGRPVVATATGGVGDWLEDGVNGLLAAPGDVDGLAAKLNELLADPERQRVLGEAGRELTRKRFSPQSHVAALVAAYRQARASWEGGER